MLNATQIVVTGRRPFLYSYDLISGVVSKTARVKGRDENSLEHAICSPDQVGIV